MHNSISLKKYVPVNRYFLWLKRSENGMFTACVLKTPRPGQIPIHIDVMVLHLLLWNPGGMGGGTQI